LEEDQVCLEEDIGLVKIPMEEIAQARLELELKKSGKEA
jgi:hypothetical protein